MVHDGILLGISILGLGFITLLLYFLATKVKDPQETRTTRNAPTPANANAATAVRNQDNGVRQRRRSEPGDEDDDVNDNDNENDEHHMSKKDILKHEKRRAKIAMKQAEDARREAKKEKEEKKMELLREKEIERDREFQIKEQMRLEAEARLAKDYNSWKDPYDESDYPLSQDTFVSSFVEKIQLQKVIAISTLAEDFNLPLVVCLRFIQQLVHLRKLDGVIDSSGNFHLLNQHSLELVDDQRIHHLDLLHRVGNGH